MSVEDLTFKINRLSPSTVEVSLHCGATTINLGMLNDGEQEALARVLESAIIDLGYNTEEEARLKQQVENDKYFLTELDKARDAVVRERDLLLKQVYPNR